jgi:hypothetical protein
MEIRRSLQKCTPSFVPVILFLTSLACGISSNAAIPTSDPNLIQTTIAGTSAAAQFQTLTANPTLTFTPESTSTSTLTPTPSFTPTPSLTPTLSPKGVVDKYLTAIERRNWEIAYDYLCPAIKEKIHTPEEMATRIFLGHIWGPPIGHTFLIFSDNSNIVQFKLFGEKWWSDPYEARVEETSLKICGVGIANGDLNYLLFPGEESLGLIPFENQ